MLTRQLDIFLLAQDEVALWTKLGLVELSDGDALLGEAPELFAVETSRVVQRASAIDDGDCFVLAEQDLVRAKIAIWTADLDLRHVFLLEADLAVDARRVTSHTQARHAKGVVWQATECRSRLACAINP